MRIYYLKTWNLVENMEKRKNTEHSLEYTKLQMFQDYVFCCTPKGKVIKLPRGATPIDFAYELHTELGNNASSALINGQNMPLNSTISNGDTVEIIKSKNQGPKLDWLNPDLGYVSTNKSRFKIRQWLRKE